MRIIDSHVHVLDNYPPMDPFQDLGRPDRILALMDACEVEKTVMLPIVADFSPNNNEECAQWVRDHPDRFALLANVQLEQPDAVERVDEAKEKLGAVGTSYYPPTKDLQWLTEPACDSLWEVYKSHDLVCNLHVRPPNYSFVITLARKHPEIRFVMNHFGLAGAGDAPEEDAKFLQLRDAADLPNIFVKASGFYHVAVTSWDFRCPGPIGHFSRLLELIGPKRILWGSDWPPSANHLTYRQNLEIVRTIITDLDDTTRPLVLGENAARVFKI